MTGDTTSGAAASRAVELCERIRECAAKEKERALTDTDSPDEFDSLFADNMEKTVRELVGLIRDIQPAGSVMAPSEKLKKEMGITLDMVEDAIHTVNEAREKVRGLIDESRLRRDAIRAYDSIHAS